MAGAGDRASATTPALYSIVKIKKGIQYLTGKNQGRRQEGGYKYKKRGPHIGGPLQNGGY
jgi:hypothetical protein